MYLKNLTLRGFKSFASSTTLHFEPGISCVVGPNGSGKSNVVDAIAWVLGEQGAKALRGGKMEDVIFAGTADRPPLGRAEVVLTIDNSDGALPSEYTEVTISRTMFRNGGSDYAINGQACRLLDVQDLLGDSGIGREMHVIVGQGQLDAILAASPEDRRGFVEEAAGVLKHRKRKEKALRKLEATGANLTRLEDLLGEIRRQLKPLSRQAEVARRAAAVQAEVREARAHLLADDVTAARAALHREVAAEASLRERRARSEAVLAEQRARESTIEQAQDVDAPRLAAAHETWHQLGRLRERLHGTHALAVERCRVVPDEPLHPATAPEPAELEAQAQTAAAQEDETAAQLAAERVRLEDVVTRRRTAEGALSEEEARVAGLLAATADRRESLARLTGQASALRSRAAAAEEELARLRATRQTALDRARLAERDFTALETTVAGLDAGERGLDAEHEAAELALRDLDDRLGKTREELQSGERERAALLARAEALESGLTGERDAAGVLLAAADPPRGVLGSVADLLSVRPGHERALSAALRSAADAVAMDSLANALDALHQLKGSDGGRATMVVAAEPTAGVDRPALPSGAMHAIDVVEAGPGLLPAMQSLLAGVVVVDDLPAARNVVTNQPELVAVTRDGDVVGRHLVAGGSGAARSRIEERSALDETRRALADTTHRCERLRFDVSRLEDEHATARRRVDVALAKLHESDAALAAVAERLAELAALARTAKAEASRLQEAMDAAASAHEASVAGLASLEQRLRAAEAAPAVEPPTEQLAALRAAARASRQAETEARLGVRSAEERVRALDGRAAALRRAAAARREEQHRDRTRRERRVREVRNAHSVAAAAELCVARAERSLTDAAAVRAQVERDRAERDRQLGEVRERIRELGAELERLTEHVHRDEVARTEQRIRVEQLEQRSLDELGLDADTLVQGYGPGHLVSGPLGSEPTGLAPTGLEPRADAAPALGPDEQAQPAGIPYAREEAEQRLRSAERALAVLGRVNPLALEEFGALEERHKFLTEQLEDLRRTRGDLLAIVRDVDERVEIVLREAFRDTAREFENVFDRLFPGGEGRLVLTDPADLLTSGIEVEARPPGKKVKRLSLLSGGERSLVAVAFLLALFKARPSPFYILDEVEAALDDTNLGRLLEIYEELRETSQVLVITHQKRTMEVADALYGVAMRGDGVSAVISQRLREVQPA